MNNDERIIRINELKSLKENISKELLNKNEDNKYGGESSGKVKTLSNGHYKESKEFDYFDKKAGMINVLMLAVISFIFESLFLFILFMIFN